MRRVFPTQTLVFCPVIGHHQNLHQFKTRHQFLLSLHTALPLKKHRKGDCERYAGLRMPAYATNMRMKFPIIALALEIITIILFAVFVVYDDGKGHGHGHDAHSNETHPKPAQPMELYPSKSTGVGGGGGAAERGMLCYWMPLLGH